MEKSSIVQFTVDTSPTGLYYNGTLRVCPQRRQIIGLQLVLAYLYIAVLTKPSVMVRKAIKRIEL